MKETQPLNPQDNKVTAAEQRQVKVETQIASINIRPGHTMFEFDLATGLIERAKFESVSAVMTSVPKEVMHTGTTIRKKVIQRDNCLYASALNKVNALKKFIPMYERLVANGTIVRTEIKPPSYICPSCNGDGKLTCSNPDHAFISGIGGEISRLGCPVCGHDENHKVPNGGACDDCDGNGEVTAEQCLSILKDWGIDSPIEDYLIATKEEVSND